MQARRPHHKRSPRRCAADPLKLITTNSNLKESAPNPKSCEFYEPHVRYTRYSPRHARAISHVGGTVMTFATVALLGMTVGQPLGPDYYPMNSRTIKLPIEYKKDRKSIRQVLLYVARNGENTWYQEGFVTPDKDAFVYVAKDDGIYWFKMVIEDLKGNKDPADLTRDPPDLKMVIDTAAPQIRVTNARRSGEEVVVEWSV